MKIALDVLRRWLDLPEETREVRRVMDEVGLEVKRIEQGKAGPEGRAPVFTLELLANRGDHRCYEGVARELHGRLGGQLRIPSPPPLETGVSLPLRVSSELCLLYTATLLERRKEGEEMDARAARVIEAAGIHAISGPVDATNITNLEIGQPTHSFDADTIEGVLTVRLSRPGEKAWPLFQPEKVELPPGTLVIADDVKILAIAGVIGCEESKTTASTKRLLLESACFDPVAVRKASQALRIHTDSSARFERGSDPERPLWGAGRVVELLEGKGAWARTGPTTLQGAWRNPGRVISLSPAQTSRFLELPLQPAEIAERLSRYGFQTRMAPAGKDGEERILASVPSWRLWDVEFEADLYEELAKSVGYDTTPTSLPEAGLGALPSPAELRKAQVEDVLVGNGFFEVFTDGFYGRAGLAQLGIPDGHPLSRHVETTNAVDRAYSLLKNNALHQAIEAVALNERHRVADVKIFEWTRVFFPADGPLPKAPDPARPPCIERKLLWAVASGRDRARSWLDTARPADAHFLKGLVEELSVELGLDLQVGTLPADHELAAFLHPGRRAAVVAWGDVVGVIGEVHPAVCKRYKLKSARPCYLQIDAEWLGSALAHRPPYEEPESNQLLVRSVSLGLPLHLDAGDVMAVMHASAPDCLARIDVVDLFLPETSDAPIRSLTFELHYSNLDGELTADAANAATEAMIRAVLDQFSSRGVHQR